MTRRALVTLIALPVLLAGWWGGCRRISNMVSDSTAYEGDPSAFIGKKVIINLRGGAWAPYGQPLPCVILRVEDEAIVVHALHATRGSYPQLYSRLVELQKVSRVPQEEDVFLVRRAEINRIWELTLDDGF